MDHINQGFKALGCERGQQVLVGATCIVLTILLVTWFSRKRQGLTESIRLPPGPKGWPILGAFPYLSGHKHVALYKMSTKYGPLMFMHLGSVPTLVVSNAEMAKEVYTTNDRLMASRPHFSLSSYLVYNSRDLSFAPYGNHWRQARKICTLELFNASRLSHFQDKRSYEIKKMVQSMFEESQKGNTIEAIQYFQTMTMNIMTQMMWNKSHRTYGNASDQIDKEFMNLFREINFLVGADNIGDFIPRLGWLSMNLQGLGNRVAIAHKKLDKFIEDILREHRQQQSLSTSAEKEAPSDGDDFVSVLLSHMVCSEAGQPLSEAAVKGILTDMIVAGSDTTANTLEWSLAELARRPHIMKRVQDELSLVIGPNRLISEEDLPKLTYLNAVAKETLRLHPITPLGLPHASIEDCKINGFHVPAGSLVFINLWAIQRDPEMWERPLVFDPDRFLNQETGAGVDYHGQSFHFIPFGAGRRGCPGMSLASTVLQLALGQALHCLEWSLPGEQKPEDLDMTEYIGIQCSKNVPLILTAKPRLSYDVIVSEPLVV